MKKFLFLLMVGVLLSDVCYSQVMVERSTAPRTNVAAVSHVSSFVCKFGAKVGVNMSSLSNDMAIDPGFSYGVGMQVGVLANMRWGQRTENSLPGTGWFGFQPEVLFAYQSVKTNSDNLKFSYITVPLMLKVYPTASFSVEVGPEFAYLLSTSPSSFAVDKAEIAVGDCKGLDVLLGVGAAYDFDFGLTVGARYNLGLTELAKNLPWKSNSIQVSVGWLF